MTPLSPAVTNCSCVAWEWHQPGNSAEHQLQPCSPLSSSSGRCNMLKYLLYGLCVPRAWPSFSRTERWPWLERGVLTAPLLFSEEVLKQTQITVSGDALLGSAVESLLLLHSMKRVVEDWQWQHYSDPGPWLAMAGFLVSMSTKEGEKQRGQESRVHLQVRLNIIEVKNLFLIWQIPALSILCRAYNTDTFHL